MDFSGRVYSLFAGMPVITLSDFARLRVETVSFFLVVVFASAWGVNKLWNSLGHDFPKLPRLTYRKALAVVVLWGLLFVIVLTMIFGARELMTPGAWVKKGATYTLSSGDNQTESPNSAAASTIENEQLSAERESHLRLLYAELIKQAAANDGRFPSDANGETIDAAAWEVPGAFHTRYVYVPGRTVDDAEKLLACEPEVYGKTRFVLFVNGRILRASTEEIESLFAAEKRP